MHKNSELYRVFLLNQEDTLLWPPAQELAATLLWFIGGVYQDVVKKAQLP